MWKGTFQSEINEDIRGELHVDTKNIVIIYRGGYRKDQFCSGQLNNTLKENDIITGCLGDLIIELYPYSLTRSSCIGSYQCMQDNGRFKLVNTN